MFYKSHFGTILTTVLSLFMGLGDGDFYHLLEPPTFYLG